MKKALVVGINKYPSAPLYGCVKDATDFSNLIASNGDHSANFNVLLQTDVPRKSKLRELIQDLFSGKNETALLYFSGHGHIDELGGYLLTPDHRRYDEGISMNDILTLANNSATTNKVIILDCCYSGAITAPLLTHATVGHINEGIAILTASKRDEVAMEVNGKGVFTNLLLEALKGGAANINGHITPGSIYAYIDQALGAWEQRPVFKTNVSKFTVLRNVNPMIENSTIKRITDYFPLPTESLALDPSYEYTNDPELKHTCIAPFATDNNVKVFNDLQKMQRAGLVEPVGEDHMYWAAINKKACRLTLLGLHYWRLVKEKKI
jgi:uncharacterized caspase-like protein